MAERYGLKLVYKTPFAEFFEQQLKLNDGRGLLGRMQALEVQNLLPSLNAGELLELFSYRQRILMGSCDWSQSIYVEMK